VTTPPLALAAALAWGLARRVPSPRQRVIAGTLTGLLAINIGEQMVRPWFALNVVVWLAWYAVTACGVVAVLTTKESPGPARAPGRGRRAYPGLVGVILPERAPLASVALRVALVIGGLFVAATMAVHFERTMDLERGAFALSLCVQLLAALRFLSRGKPSDDAQRVALVLAASTCCDVAGAWWYHDPVAHWPIGQIQALITWAAIAAWEGRCLIRVRR
jgi:xanthosine utilization system XapX-like protein